SHLEMCECRRARPACPYRLINACGICDCDRMDCRVKPGNGTERDDDASRHTTASLASRGLPDLLFFGRTQLGKAELPRLDLACGHKHVHAHVAWLCFTSHNDPGADTYLHAPDISQPPDQIMVDRSPHSL